MGDRMTSSIRNEDCRAFLSRIPDGAVQTIVSSPPYNIGKAYEKRTALDRYLDEQTEVLAECARTLGDGGSIFWQVGAYSKGSRLIPLDVRFFPILEDLGLVPRNRIIWIRQHGLHGRKKFSCRHETTLWFTKGENHKFRLDNVRVPQKYQNKKSWRGENKGALTCNPEGKNPGDIWLFRNVKHNHEEQTIHPCQFPEDLVARAVLSTTDEGDVVLDPYMGTGTVPVVARDHNRVYLGCDSDPTYFEVAQRRLNGTPNKEGSFANLKCLRDHAERTGEPIEAFRFDVQTGKKPTERARSRIFDEGHHQEQLFTRLDFEEHCFAADVRGEPRPEDPLPHNRASAIGGRSDA